MLLLGDCLLRLRELPDNSVDSVVTDPPYGLSFMGKKWDYEVPSKDIFKEILRVLKPGGHALIACGTRTQHRMAVNIEDAGFEIRDVITWLYGSGFPKSLDISKAIDKAAGAEREILSSRLEHNIKGSAEGSRLHTSSGNRETIEVHVTAPSTNAAKQWQGWGTALKPSTEHWTLAQKPLCDFGKLWYETHTLCRLMLNVLPAEFTSKLNLKEFGAELNTVQWNVESSINTLADLHARMATLQSESDLSSNLSIVLLWQNILGALLGGANTFTTEMASSLTIDLKTLNCLVSNSTRKNITQDETLPNGAELNASYVKSFLTSVLIKLSCIQTTDAQSTVALNPNAEFITLARKPLSESTVAKNVLKHGTGGLNIDACRVEAPDAATLAKNWDRTQSVGAEGNTSGDMGLKAIDLRDRAPQGRFPANLILDEEAGRLLDEQSGTLKNGGQNYSTKGKSMFGTEKELAITKFAGDSGGASRFFFKVKDDTLALECPNIQPSQNHAIDAEKSSGACLQSLGAFVQKLAATQTMDLKTGELQAYLDSIGSCKNFSLMQNLVSHVESLASTDTTEITASLWKLFGYVLLAIEESTKLESQSVESGLAQATRFKYVAKASKAERNAGLEGMPEKDLIDFKGKRLECLNCGKRTMVGSTFACGCEKPNPQWIEETRQIRKANANNHPTVKPIKLMEYLIKLITPEGGTVLDPFAGSGSTLVAAKRLGFKFIGCEMNPEYLEIATKRIAHAAIKEQTEPEQLSIVEGL